MEKNKGLWIIAAYVFLSVYLLPMFPHGGSANELTHWATAASLVERSSFEIGWTADLIGPIVDSAKVGDAVYSNKPPGTAILAAPVYALTRAFIGPPNDSNIRVSWLAMRLFVSTLPLLLLAGWLYVRDTDELSLAVLLFASPLFVYSLLFFSHVLVGVLLYIAFRIVYDSRRIFLRNCFLSGAVCGLAVISEFPAAIPVAAIGGGLLFTDRRDRLRNLFFFVAGGAPLAAAFLAYNHAVFGSPFVLSYAFESFPEWPGVAAQGVFVIGYPTPSNFYLLLFSPARGLLYCAPILSLAIVAFLTSRESKSLRHRVKVAAVVLTVVSLSAHGAAHGGSAFGPRYIVMIVPLLLDSFFDGEIYDMSNIWQGFLFAVSFLLCSVPALTFPLAPPEFRYPHNGFWGRMLWEENWFAPNMANVFGAPSAWWTMIPAAVALGVVMYLVWRYARRPARFFSGAVAGTAVVIGYFLLPNLDSAENRLRRATISESYFKPADRMEAFRQTVPRERLSGLEWNIADIRAFGPNDFPYLETRERTPSPTMELRRAAVLQQTGDTAGAESILRIGRDAFGFARCEFGTELAVLLYASERRPDALAELLAVQQFVGPNARPDCLRSQFLLGSLYRENGQADDANRTFRMFLANSENSDDPQIKAYRQQLGER